MESSPSCWKVYGDVLAREFSDPTYMAVHRLTVDTYAVQHPGQPSPQSIQSVAIHLIGLYAVLELRLSFPEATVVLRRAADKMKFKWLDRPRSLGAMTAADVTRAQSASEHSAAVHAWAESAWKAWAIHHPQVREWAARARRVPA